jgi:hypothetical protein
LGTPRYLCLFYFVRKSSAALQTPSSLFQTFIWPVHHKRLLKTYKMTYFIKFVFASSYGKQFYLCFILGFILYFILWRFYCQPWVCPPTTIICDTTNYEIVPERIHTSPPARTDSGPPCAREMKSGTAGKKTRTERALIQFQTGEAKIYT